MPRKGSLDVPDALHHIVVRGINRRKTFEMTATGMISWIGSAISCPIPKKPENS